MNQHNYKHRTHSDNGNTVTVACAVLKTAEGLPRVVFIDGDSGDQLALKPVNGEYPKPLWFKKANVYRYDPAIVAAIETAHKKGNMQELKKLWQSVPTFESSDGTYESTSTFEAKPYGSMVLWLLWLYGSMARLCLKSDFLGRLLGQAG